MRMENALMTKFPLEQKITIRNVKGDNRVMTRPWLSARHLVDRGWEVIGSEALESPTIKKTEQNGNAAPVASVKINNDSLFTLEELKIKYKDLTGRMPYHNWDKETILEKIKGYGEKA